MVSDKVIKVLFITSAYPTEDQPFLGHFVKDLETSLMSTGKVDLKTVSLVSPRGFPQIIFHLVKLYFKSLSAKRRFKPDIVHAHWVLPNGLIARLISKKYVITAYGASIFLTKGGLQRSLLKFAVKKANFIASISNYTKQELYTKGEVDSDIVYFGPSKKLLSLLKTKSITSKKKENLIICVGSLIERKGHRYAIEALKLLRNKGVDLKLLFIGNGPLKEELGFQIDKLNLTQYVDFKSNISYEELQELMERSQALIHPAVIDSSGDTEGLGLVLLESTLLGTTVIASKVGGITEIIHDDETGYLVPEKQPDKIAEKVMQVLEKPEKVIVFRKNLIEKYLNKFEYDYISKQYLDAYRMILLR